MTESLSLLDATGLAEAPDVGDAEALARARWRRARLDELAGIGMGQARDLRDRCEGQAEGVLGAIARRFAQVARAIRLIVLLGAWVEAQLLALLRGERPAPSPASPPAEGRRAAPRAEAAAAADPAADPEPAEQPEPVERHEAESERRVERELGERFVITSWNQAMHAICDALDIADRSRFLEPAPPAPIRPPAEEAAGLAAPLPTLSPSPPARTTFGDADPPDDRRRPPPKPPPLRLSRRARRRLLGRTRRASPGLPTPRASAPT